MNWQKKTAAAENSRDASASVVQLLSHSQASL